jgi:Complex I intermediate-associated protein 30 (CIA30)
MSNLYRYLLPKAGGGWLRRYYQHKKLLVSMELQSSDAVPMPPISIFDFTREVDFADATTISSTTVDGWTVSDDGVINGASTSNAVLIRTSQCWQNHMQSTNHRVKTKSKSTTSPQQPNKSTEKSLQERLDDIDSGQKPASNDDDDDDDDNDSVELLSRPYIRWYGTLNTTIGLESKVQRSGFCAIRSPMFPFDGASLQGLYSYLEIQCRYIPVLPKTTITKQHASQESNPNNHQNIINHNQSQEGTTTIPNSESQVEQQGPTRIFTMNLRVTSALNDDIYQGHLALDHPITTTSNTPTTFDHPMDGIDDNISIQPQSLPPFRTFVIPFDELLLTARGREREYQRRLMGSVDIESIGFLLMDNIEGPFQFDIAQIRAVNCLDDGSVYESPSQISRATDISEETTRITQPTSVDDDTKQ